MASSFLNRALVTGATGFIGRHLVALLAGQGTRVTAMTRGTESLPAGTAAVEADVEDADAVAASIRADRFDAVFHLAGRNASAGALAVYKANVIGTATILQAVKSLGRPELRVIVAGSSAEYGASPDNPITEDSACLPVGDYGIGKLAASRMALHLHAATGQAVIVARPFNVIGPGNCNNLLHADVARQIVEIEQGRRPPRLQLRDLSAYRDFVDVRDVAQGLVALAGKGVPGQIYNLCTEHAVQARSLVEMMVERAQSPISLESSTGQPGDVPFQRGSFAKAENASGWQPRIALEKSLTDTLNYWRKAANMAPTAPFDRKIPEAFHQ